MVRSTVHHQMPTSDAVGARDEDHAAPASALRPARGSVAAGLEVARTGRTRRRPARAARRPRPPRGRARSAGGAHGASSVPTLRASATRSPRSAAISAAARADQVGPRDVAEAGRRLSKPPGLGLPPAIQKMLGKLEQRLVRRIGVGGLAVVDETARAGARDLLHPVRQAREARQGRRAPRVGVQAERADGGIGGRGVLPVVPAAQIAERGAGRRPRSASRRTACRRVRDTPASASRRARPARWRGPALAAGSARVAAGLVVDADDGGVARPWLREDPLLGGDIAVQVAVPVEMVGREVEPDRDAAAQAVAQVELVGGQLEHEDPLAAARARGRTPAGRYCRRARRRGRPSRSR